MFQKLNELNLKKLFLILSITILIFSCKQITYFDIPPITKEASGQNGMVVTAHPLASTIGNDILKQGGNAIDAAIAVHFALAVCYPIAGNIGGGGFMMIHSADGKTECLDYRETAPLKSTTDMYLNEDKTVKKNASTLGALSCGVPGSVDGMWQAHQKYGKLEWEKLLAPAIKLAEYGILLTSREVNALTNAQEELLEINGKSNPYYIENWKSSNTLTQSDLALTLKQISEKGRDGFYKGWVADSIVSTMHRHDGIISLQDLNDYRAKWRKPLIKRIGDYTIYCPPPPSSGGVALIQLLEILRQSNLDSLPYHSTAYIHLVAEAERRVYADRAEHLGDPDFYKIPIDSLIDSSYLASRMSNFNPLMATPSDSISSGVFEESDQTTHFNVIDAEGNAVSVTTTLNGAYGSKLVVRGAGFLLNNEMDDFSIKPGVPNLYGLVGSEANKIEPKKRMLSSMTPTIILKGNKCYALVGTPGGSTIITSVLQTILNLTQEGFTPQESVNSGRFHHQWRPDTIFFESGTFNEEVIDSLKKMGHGIAYYGAIGRVELIEIVDGLMYGAADPRGDDCAMGY